MKFAIASVTFWEAVGFDTSEWRKNKDGTKALVHLEFAKVLVPDAEENESVNVYDCQSETFNVLMESEEWRYEDIY